MVRLPITKYTPGATYKGRGRVIKFRYMANNRMYFVEDGERKSLHRSTFYNLKLKQI